MVAPVDENTNVPLILIVMLFFCMLEKHIIGDIRGVFRGGQDFFDPQIVLSAAKGNFGVKKVVFPA
jgi:hypothetical protein